MQATATMLRPSPGGNRSAPCCWEWDGRLAPRMAKTSALASKYLMNSDLPRAFLRDRVPRMPRRCRSNPNPLDTDVQHISPPVDIRALSARESPLHLR